MKNNFKSFVFILLSAVFLLPSNLNATLELPFDNPSITISMDFKDATLKDILKILSIQSGLNFIASEGIEERRMTLYLDKVGIKDAMDQLFKANNLAYELNRDANIFIVKDLGKPRIETITKVFYLKYVSVPSSALIKEKNMDVTSSMSSSGSTTGGSTGSTGSSSSSDAEPGIVKAIEKVLTEYGSVIEDYRTNSLVVTDTPNNMPRITQTIASLDISLPQVLLEVEMLDVSKNTVDKLGVKFGQTPLTMVLSGAKMSTPWPFIESLYRNKSLAKTMTAGNVDFSTQYTVLLDFLRTQTDTKYLARPRILTISNETAEIRISTNESVGVKTTTEASSGTTSAEPERAETGVILRVTPQVNPDTGEITMCVYPKVAEAVAGTSLTSNNNTFTYRDPEERSAKSLVRILDGDTVVIGGLIRNEFAQVTTKLPYLSDIPFLGKLLFTHKGGSSDKDKTRELLIFITPHIIKDTNTKLAQAKVTNKAPEREQNAASGVLDRESAISSSLNAFDKKRK